MAPSDQEIEQALLDGTYQVYRIAPEDTSVNKVRKQAEQSLGLEDGFLSGGNWKQKSKVLIKGRVEKLLDGWVPDDQEADEEADGLDGDVEKTTGKKRASPEIESPPPKPKRQKRAPKPKKPAKKPAKKLVKKAESDLTELSDLSELSELSEEEKPQKKRKRAAAARKTKPIDSDNEDAAVQSENETPKPEATVKGDGDEDKIKSGEADSEEKFLPIKQGTPGKDGKPDTKAEDEEKPVVDEEEEYSDVIDEPVKPKRKKKDKKEAASKPAKAPKAASKKTATSDDPDTEEIKRLQAHLVKCGVRKLWHNELKEYGDDSKAKIRHLRQMLTDAGMDGRFSEAKAREIKERRELMAELEAAKEMNALWGVESRGRASRSKSKNTKTVESEGSGGEENVEEEKEDEDNTYAARRKRVRADLAFLGDDSDSE
ncbi:hypothetical protein FZEAL_4018 [Fusarium zealandicum]|uniref:Transcriptional regulator n=1 Tax=Fusarium zealandicum TaxID=1053134 RepID=A0A8H4UMP5_9HYPO|nr:hypothetical protein FZEAL_4018 [Fusarium zealandicum]